MCSGTFFFIPTSIRKIAEEFQDRVRFSRGPEVIEYGMLEFGIQNPNGDSLPSASRPTQALLLTGWSCSLSVMCRLPRPAGR